MDKDQLKRHIHKSDLTALEKRYLEGLVDAEPVRHGRWIEKCRKLDWCEDDVEEYFECSECTGEAGYKSKYCPDCGAKMDGKEE